MGLKGFRHTEETKQLLSKLARERWANPASRRRNIEAIRKSFANGRVSSRKGAILTDETKRKISEAAKKRTTNPRQGAIHSPERLMRQSAIAKALWQDPEYVKKTLAKKRRYSAEAKARLNISRRGNRNPNWKGGQVGYNKIRLSTKHWKMMSKRVMKADNYTCQRCESQRSLQVHHIIPHLLGGPDEEWNLITYCKSCHTIVEHQEGAIKISMEMIA